MPYPPCKTTFSSGRALMAKWLCACALMLLVGVTAQAQHIAPQPPHKVVPPPFPPITTSPYLAGIISIAAGNAHSLALKNDGTVWAWGENAYGELGTGTFGTSTTPVQVVGPNASGFLTGIVAIATGEAHSLALRSDGTVWAWGENAAGALGNGMYSGNPGSPNKTEIPTPGEVVSPTGYGTLTGIVAIAAGSGHSLALKSDGTVWAWGGDYNSQLGNDTYQYPGVAQPVQVVGPNGSGFLTGIIAIAGGSNYSLALKNDGTVWAWGDNTDGELGNGTFTGTSIYSNGFLVGYVIATPVQVVGPNGSGFLSGVVAIAAGPDNSKDFNLALKSDGTVWAWGGNNAGQLGNGTFTGSSGSPGGVCIATPVQVVGPNGSGFLSGIIAIAAGGSYGLALKSDGTVWAWGDNEFGELGNGTFLGASGSPGNGVCTDTPGQVVGPNGSGSFDGAVALAAGVWHTVALKSDGTVWTWGYNYTGQLGNGTFTITGYQGIATPGEVVLYPF